MKKVYHYAIRWLAFPKEAVFREWLFIVVFPCCQVGICVSFNVPESKVRFQRLWTTRPRTVRYKPLWGILWDRNQYLSSLSVGKPEPNQPSLTLGTPSVRGRQYQSWSTFPSWSGCTWVLEEWDEPRFRLGNQLRNLHRWRSRLLYRWLSRWCTSEIWISMWKRNSKEWPLHHSLRDINQQLLEYKHIIYWPGLYSKPYVSKTCWEP